ATERPAMARIAIMASPRRSKDDVIDAHEVARGSLILSDHRERDRVIAPRESHLPERDEFAPDDIRRVAVERLADRLVIDRDPEGPVVPALDEAAEEFVGPGLGDGEGELRERLLLLEADPA